MEYKTIRIHFTSKNILRIRIAVGEGLKLDDKQILIDHVINEEPRQIMIN